MKQIFGVAVALLSLAGAGLAHAATEWNTQDYDLYSGDFDGDGKADILYIAKDQSKASGIARSVSGAASTAFQTWPSNYLGIPWSGNLYTPIVADFNGDARADILMQRSTAGDHYLLLADPEGKITAISQSIPNSYASVAWSADQHKLVAGDFNGDGRSDLFLQATNPSLSNAVILANVAGQFPSTATQTWSDGYLGFKWSTKDANVFAGNFNGIDSDGFKRSDLLIQARPRIVMIDYDVAIPIPTYPPNMNGVVRAAAGATIFQAGGVQAWSRNANGVDWSPLTANILVADFNGDGISDVLLQARNSGRPSYLVTGNSSGAIFSAGSQLASNVTWSGDSFRLIAGNFDGSGGVGVYFQSTAPGGTNYYADTITGGSVALSTHDPSSSTGVVPTTAVGHTVGSYAVSNTGAATYSIPVVVPTGIAGIQPSLSIGYSSGAGNGLLGVGWGLGGISEIERCGKTLAQDGSTDGVQLTANDRFCLDGNKLRSTGGTYGGNLSTYQTELETFARITSHGAAGNGPASFEVQGKDGLVYTYGGTADSQIEAVNSDAASTIFTWALSQVRDRSGNTMTISYQEDGAPNGSSRPTQILYTTNSAAGVSSPSYRVGFYWETRPDTLIHYVAGGRTTETNRLNRIETQYLSGGSWSLVRKYQLSYNNSGAAGRSRLKSVQECGRDGSCMAPTTIAWQDGLKGWSNADSVVSGSDGSASMDYSYPLDFDGDGRTDLIYPQGTGSNKTWHYMQATVNGYGAPVNTGIAAGDASNVQYAFARPIDLYGNGQMGLLVTNPGSGTRPVLRWNGATLALTNTSITTALDGKQWIGDFTGDGLQDFLFATSSAGTIHLQVQKNLGGSFDVAQTFYSGPDNGYSLDVLAENPQPFDFNGDGRSDFLYSLGWVTCTPMCASFRDWYMLTSTGSSFVLAKQEPCRILGPGSCSPVAAVADFNADGMSDIIRNMGSSATINYGSSTGLSGNVSVPLALTRGMPVDYDGDGRSDLLYLLYADNSATWVVARSTGTGFEQAVPVALPYSMTLARTVRILDIDGDGQLDIGYQNPQYRVRKHNGSAPDLLSSITDGFGNSVVVSYAPLTNASVYTVGSGAVFPVIDLRGPMYVVQSSKFTDGLGGTGTYNVSETYAGARAHAQGRGFLGFATRTTIDDRTDIKSVANFSQTYPYIGMLSSSTTYQPNGVTPISQVTNTFAELPVQGVQYQERRFPYLYQSVQTNYEVGGAGNGLAIAQVTTTNTIDSNGNPTNVTTTTVDQTDTNKVYTAVTANTYGDATCAWRGFATQQQVASTVPGFAAQTRTVQFVRDTANPNACRVYQEIVEPSDNAVKVTTTILYDTFGNPNSQSVSAANIETRTTTTSYGVQGVFPTSMTQTVTGSFSQSAYKTYDYALSVPLTATDPNALQTRWDYDGFGRLYKETRPDGTKTIWNYGACGIANNYCGDGRLRYQVTKQELDATNPGNVIRSSMQLFDAFGRSLYDQARTLSGAMSTVATNYDNQGRASQRSQPYFAGYPAYFTIVAYDLIGRPVSETRRVSEADSGNQTTTYGYNRLVHTQTDANSRTTTKRFNAVGQVAQVTDAASGITSYEYDQFGNLKTTTDPSGNQIVNTFNIRGHKLSTNDPDMGYWSYTYYPTGELWTQTDAKSQTVAFTYDRLSRPTTRVEYEGTTTFNYGESQSSRNIGRLLSVSSPGSYSESYSYDALGRLQNATTNADATSFVVSNAYDANTGFLETVTYPTSTAAVPGSRFKVKYEYDNGMMKRVRDFHTPTTVYWEQVATNAAGQTIDEQLGNGLRTYSTYDGLTGLLGMRTTGSSAQIQNLTYQWDKVGNLTQRKDQAVPLTEDFYYDNLYRLDYSRLNGVATPNLDVAYDALGNITSKAEGGATRTYNYNAAQTGCSYYTHTQPHAVRKLGTKVYCYDQNGNMTKRDASNITWYSYNMPNRIDHGSNCSQFYYGADRSRYKQVAYTAAGGSLPAGSETTIYVGGLFEKVTKPSSVIEYKHYIMAGKQAVAIRTLRSNSANDTRYLHKDHLGSVDAITNESGGVVVRLSYDAFGKRRNAVSWSGTPSAGDWASIASVTHRAFTFHEQLNNVELVHMNGRVYDPDIGRFISADPFIQAPLMSQSLNRYSYVMNNPLSMIDPSGYSWLSKAFRSVRRGLHAALRFHVAPTPKNFFEMIKATPGQKAVDRYVMTHQWAYSVGQFAATVATSWSGGWGGAVWASYYTYAGTGSVTQALRVGAVTYATSWAMQAVGAYYGDSWTVNRFVLEGAIGGTAAVALGGDFEDGFLWMVGASATRALYRSVVRYQETWESGGGPVQKQLATKPIEGANNVGTQGHDLRLPIGLLAEGGSVSRLLNRVPGINATAGLHDHMMVALREPWRGLLNFPTMLPTAGVTVAAISTDHTITYVYGRARH